MNGDWNFKNQKLLAIQKTIKNPITFIMKSLYYSTLIKLVEICGKLVSTKLIFRNFMQIKTRYLHEVIKN